MHIGLNVVLGSIGVIVALVILFLAFLVHIFVSCVGVYRGLTIESFFEDFTGTTGS
jgi:hypothetical protein